MQAMSMWGNKGNQTMSLKLDKKNGTKKVNY